MDYLEISQSRTSYRYLILEHSKNPQRFCCGFFYGYMESGSGSGYDHAWRKFVNLARITCACIISLSGFKIFEIDIVRGNTDIRVIAGCDFFVAGSVGINHTKCRICFAVFLVDQGASVEIVTVDAVVCNDIRRTTACIGMC